MISVPNKKRLAFTLIELMIALGLLGALMAVAWSLLGTFRDAEIRGWKLSSRTQTIRSARAWLEDDIQHLAIVDSNMSGNDAGPSKAHKTTKSLTKAPAPQSLKAFRFTGNAMGFSTVIAPSIDPIPFLENLMSDSVQLERKGSPGESLLGTATLGEESSLSTASSSPWPAETVEIEYRLTPVLSDDVSPSGPLANNSDQTQFVLTRREMLDKNTESAVVSPSEQVLTAKDLYRQSDEDGFSRSQPIRELRLEGLIKAQFRYFDGTAWRSDWSSLQQSGWPQAIAFGFDFPAASDMKPPFEATAPQRDRDSLSTEGTLSTDLPLAGSVMSTEATAEVASSSDQGLMESSTNEVQIVIFVGKRSSMGKAADSSSLPRDFP